MKEPIKSTKKSLKVYETDASRIKGKASDVLIAKTLKEISDAVKSNSNITARGAGTGLAGGAVPEDGLVIELNKLNKILKFDKKKKRVVVQAGIILDKLNNYLGKEKLEFPINPSSHAICTIGGMVATNAVGSRAVKYGRTSDWIGWVEVIDNKGRLQRKGKDKLSDYAGLEGTTGIIVNICLKLSEKKQRTANFIAVDTIQEVISIVKELRSYKKVSMIEFFGKQVAEILNLEKKYHLLIEYESNKGGLKGAKYTKILALRDRLYPVLASKGYSKIEDPKIYLDVVDKLMEFLEKHKIPVFGHLGVGILHPCFNKEKEYLIDKMMKLVKRLHGKVSGEHGIGLLKKNIWVNLIKKLIDLFRKE